MPTESPMGKFPKPNKQETADIIDALIADSSPVGARREGSFRDDIKYHPSSSVPRKNNRDFISPLLREQEVRVKMEKGSVSALIYNIIGLKYFNISNSTEKKTKDGNFSALSSDSKERSELITAIFSDPVIQVLAMDVPDADIEGLLEMGLDLEKSGILPAGTAYKSYARRLLVDKYKKPRKPKGKDISDEFETYVEEHIKPVTNGFAPLTDEKATPLIEEAISNILKEEKYI